MFANDHFGKLWALRTTSYAEGKIAIFNGRYQTAGRRTQCGVSTFFSGGFHLYFDDI
jgi:hypothetical protein